MKKNIFALLLACVTGLSVASAASFVGFEATNDNTLGNQIHSGGIIQNMVNTTLVETNATEHKYYINLISGGEGTFQMGGVTFAFTGDAAGRTAYKTYNRYIQPGGMNREIRIPTVNGEQVNIVLTEACSGILVNGISRNFTEGSNILTANGDNIIVRNPSNKPKIGAILSLGVNGIVKIGDLYYNLNSSSKTAEVTKDSYISDCYSGLTIANIPSSVTYAGVNYSVTSIGDYAFLDCSSLISVTIPNSVTSIGEWAFDGCSRLTSVEIPSSITSIGKHVFSGCSSLTLLTISNSVTSIGENAFYGCTGLTSVTIGNSVTSIGNDAFKNTYITELHYTGSMNEWCIKVWNPSQISTSYDLYINGNKQTDLVIPNSVTSIGDWAFCNCTCLTSVTIPNSVTSIGKWAFSGCTGLTSVVIPNSVTSVGNNTFTNSNAIKTVVWEAKNIPDFTFPNRPFTSSISSFIFGEDVEHIPAYLCDGMGKQLVVTSKVLTPPTLGNNVFSCTPAHIYIPCGSIDAYKAATKWSTYASAIQYKPLPFEITITPSDSGQVIKPTHVCDEMALTANPNYGYAFAQWSDGNTDNPRAIELTQDTSFTALYAVAKRGTCGDDLALTWDYDDENKTLSISGNGALNSNYTYGLEAPQNMTKLVLGEGITNVGQEAFKNCSNLLSVEWNVKNCADFKKSSSIPFANTVTSITFGDNVEHIPAYICCGMDKLENVAIGDNVTSIGIFAFQGCRSLTSVTIPNSVTSIEQCVFADCSSLVSITIGNSVTSIWYRAFRDCSSLTSVIIPNSVTSIGENAFYSCTGLTSVTIGNSVTSIGNGAFSGCGNLTSVTLLSDAIVRKAYTSSSNISTIFGNQVKEYILGDNVSSIGSYAFYNCSNLTSVIIGNNCTNIGIYAFSGCGNLTSVIIGNSIASIGDRAFSSCKIKDIYFTGTIEGWVNKTWSPSSISSSYDLYIQNDKMTEIVIPNSVTTIGNEAFRGCRSLTSLEIPNSVTTIEASAFGFCSNLRSLTISNSVTSIDHSSFGKAAFYGCSIEDIYFTGTIEEWVNKTWSPSSISSSYDLYIQNDKMTEVVIPNSVTSIEYEAFSWCTGLMSVTIPNSVTTIGEGAFYNCSGLTSVTIPYSVTSIGSLAFYNCSGLMSVTIPNSVTTIGEFAFANCSGLTCVTCEAVTPPTLGERYDTFYGVNKTIPLYVPGPSIDLYKAADQWKDFMNILPIPGTEVPEYPVIFLDYNSDVLSEQSVAEGSAAVAPEVPEREGYIFKGWNVDIEHITNRTFVIALYDKEGIEITYKAEDGETIFTEQADLHIPDAPGVEGKTFAGWLTENVDKNGIVLRATYTLDNPTTDDDVTVVPGSNSANVTFPFVTGAITYVLVIRDLFGHVVCKIMFNASGRLLGIAFAPNRERSQTSAQTGNFQFTVEGLDPSTTYEYEFIAHDETDDVIETLIGSFTTTAEVPTDIESPETDSASAIKVVQNDQVLILRGDKIYTVQGQEVR